jgi:hypothetical protein
MGVVERLGQRPLRAPDLVVPLLVLQPAARGERVAVEVVGRAKAELRSAQRADRSQVPVQTGEHRPAADQLPLPRVGAPGLVIVLVEADEVEALLRQLIVVVLVTQQLPGGQLLQP